MNHSFLEYTKKVWGILGLTISLVVLTTNDVLAEGDPHYAAYELAVLRLNAGQERLLNEMEKVRLGQVKHYDFLQNEHIELLRNARALRHPPALFSPSQQIDIRAKAEEVLTIAESLEWHIADFLRSQALLSSALANTIDIASLASLEEDPASRSALQHLKKVSEEFQQKRNSKSLGMLLAVYNGLESLSDDQYREELAAQQQRVIDHAEKPLRIMEQVRDSGITEAVDALTQSFERASN